MEKVEFLFVTLSIIELKCLIKMDLLFDLLVHLFLVNNFAFLFVLSNTKSHEAIMKNEKSPFSFSLFQFVDVENRKQSKKQSKNKRKEENHI